MSKDALIRLITGFTLPLSSRIKTLLRRALLTRVKYAGNVRLIQVKSVAGQALDDIEHIEPFGFTSHPKAGAEALVLAFGGSRA